MPANRTTAVRVGCAASLLFILAAGIISFLRYQNKISCHEDRLPLTSMTLTSDPNQSKQLIEQFRQFAFDHGFRFDIANPGQEGNDFRIRMLRQDIEIITRKPSAPSEFTIEFYNNDCTYPTAATDIGALVVDLKSLISEIPNVTITEKQ